LGRIGKPVLGSARKKRIGRPGEGREKEEALVKRPSLALAVAASALVLTAGLAACGDDDDETDTAGGGGAAQLDLVIGDIVPLTGDLSDFGPPGRKAADLAVQEINAAVQQAGVNHTVEIVHEDGGSDDQGGVQAARKLLADGASCIAGDWASTATVAVARSVTTREGVMLISPASTAVAITDLDDDGLLSRTAPPDSLQSSALADQMEKTLGGLDGKTINIGARNDIYGTGFTEALTAELEGRGVTVGESVIYDPEQPAYNSEAQQLTSGNPDAWVIIDFPETYAKVGPALVRTGNWDASQSFFTDGLASTDLPGDVGREATEGMIGSAPGAFAKGSAVTAFDRVYTAAPGPARQVFDSQNFDAVMLCYLAAVAAGSTEGTAISEEITDVTGPPVTKYTFEQLPQAIQALQNGEDIDYEGASGPIDLDEAGDLTRYVYDLFRFRGGELATIDTVEVTAD
jgi:ABC-type branched-subunit amino acid transport system substrate-binding protein